MLNKSSVNFNSVVSKNIYIRKGIKTSNKNTVHKISTRKKTLQTSSLFSKEKLNNLTLIGQFDKKFLIMINHHDNSLLILDQHAIHERILFEFYSQLLIDELSLKVNRNEKTNLAKFNLLKNVYSKLFLKVPIEETNVIFKNGKIKFDKNRINNLFNFEFRVEKEKIIIYSVPVILDRILDREEYLEVFKQIVNSIDQLVLIDENFNSKINYLNLNIILEMFMNVVKSRACRDAVKFNEELDEVFIKSLIDNLKECNNPFLCAHGRHNFYIIVENKKY